MASSKKKTKAPAKKAAAKKVAKKTKAPAKKAAAKKVAQKASPKLVDYTVTQEDLDTNPEYVKKGFKVGQVIKIELKGEFHIEVTFNDATHETDTDDIAGVMLALKPVQLKTKVIVRITYKKKTAEFVLFNIKAKRIFTLPLAAQGFEKSVRTALNAL